MPPDQEVLRSRVAADPTDAQLAHVADEIELIAAILEDVEDEGVRDSVSMWVDYSIYRWLNGDSEPVDNGVTRECRRALMAHYDDVSHDIVSDEVAQQFAARAAVLTAS